MTESRQPRTLLGQPAKSRGSDRLLDLYFELAETGDRALVGEAQKIWDESGAREPLPKWIEAPDTTFAPRASYLRLELLPQHVQGIVRHGLKALNFPIRETSVAPGLAQARLIDAWVDACGLEPPVLPLLKPIAAEDGKLLLGDMLNQAFRRRLAWESPAVGENPLLREIPLTAGEMEHRAEALTRAIEVARDPSIPWPHAGGLRVPRSAIAEFERVRDRYCTLAEWARSLEPPRRGTGAPRSPSVDLARFLIAEFDREDLPTSTADSLLTSLCRIFAGEESTAKKLRERVRQLRIREGN